MADQNKNLNLKVNVDASALQRAAASLNKIVEQFSKPVKLNIPTPPTPAVNQQDLLAKALGASGAGVAQGNEPGRVRTPGMSAEQILAALTGMELGPDTGQKRMQAAANWLNASQEGHLRHLARLKANLDPQFLERRVTLQNELKKAHIDLNDALKKEQDLQGYVAEKAITDEDRRLKALQRVNAELERRRQQEADKQAGYVAEKATTGVDRHFAALRKVNSALEQQKQQLTDLDVQARPGFLRQRVENALKIEEKQRGLHFEESKERTQQMGLGRGLLDLFNIPDLSKQFAGMGGKLAGLGGSIGGGLGGLLGKAGAALAIPGVGQIAALAAVGLPMVANGVKQLAAAPFATVNAGLKGLLGPLGPIGSALSVSTGLLDGFASGLKKIPVVGSVLALAPEVLSTTLKQFSQFLEMAVSLAAKARPGEFIRLQFALDDTAAVVGHRLVPVIEFMRDVIRGVGDFLQTALPSTEDFRATIAPLREAFADIKAELAPFARLMRLVFVVGLHEASQYVRHLAVAAEILINAIPGLGALGALAGNQLESSVGAAARKVRFTSPEEAAKEIYAAAAGSGADPAKRTADNTGSMLRVLEQINDNLSGKNGFAAAAETAAQAIPGSGAVGAIAEAARSRWFGN